MHIFFQKTEKIFIINGNYCQILDSKIQEQIQHTHIGEIRRVLIKMRKKVLICANDGKR